MPSGKRERLLRLLEQKGVRPAASPTIPPRAPAEEVPLSFAQEQLWFLEQLEPDRSLYNVPGAVRLGGPLNPLALERTLNAIVARHEPLRTTVHAKDGRPYQRVAPHRPFPLAVVDLTAIEASARDAEARRLATAEAHRRLDLETGPLARFSLIRLGENEHVLVFNFHHIIADGWSMGVFSREVDQLYPALRDGRPSPLAPLPIQFADFAVWQRRWMQGKVLEDHRAFWSRELGGDLPTGELPADKPRPATPSYRGEHEAVVLAESLSASLRALSKRHGVTTFMTLLAAYKILIHAWTRAVSRPPSSSADVVVGSVIANRNRKELEGLIGYLCNTLVLRTPLGGNPPVGELLRRVRDVTLGACSYQDMPLSRLVEQVQPGRDLSRNPLFQVEFSVLTPDVNPALYNYGLGAGVMETATLAGLAATPFDVEYKIARFDVAVILWDMPDRIRGTVEYSADLFEAATIKQMVGDYELILRRMEREPEATVETLSSEIQTARQKQRSQDEERYREALGQKLRGLRRRPAAAGGIPEASQPL